MRSPKLPNKLLELSSCLIPPINFPKFTTAVMEEASDAVLREKSLEYYRGLRTIACDPDSEHADLKLLKQKIMAIQRVFVRRKALAASAKRGIPMPTKEPGSPSSKRRKVRVGRMDRSPSLFKDKTCIETALKRKPYLLKIPHCIEVDRRLAGGMSNSELNNQGGESKVSQLQKLVTPFRKKDLFGMDYTSR